MTKIRRLHIGNLLKYVFYIIYSIEIYHANSHGMFLNITSSEYLSLILMFCIFSHLCYNVR